MKGSIYFFSGIDRTMAYTKKDIDDFKGDGKQRKEIQLPKTNLGFCMPLAMESNGNSVFVKPHYTREVHVARNGAILRSAAGQNPR